MTFKIAISVGDPASIGIISTLKLLESELNKRLDSNFNYSLHIFADKNWLYQNAKQYFPTHTKLLKIFDNSLDWIQFHHNPLITKAKLSHPNPSNAGYVLDCLNQAVDFVLKKPNSALITGAVDKSIIQSSHPNFVGHTEYLAQKLGQNALMNFVIQSFHTNHSHNNNQHQTSNQDLHIALTSDHLSLLDSINKLKKQDFLKNKILLFNDELQNKFKIPSPKIGVLGLNPHAGENGSLGSEEIELIIPIIEKLRLQGLDLTNPIPADSALLVAKKLKLNGLMSLYHDQLLAVIKYSFFDCSVNTTLGLNLIRTSVDHGTAFDIAEKIELINPKPLINALNQAIKMIEIKIN